MLVLYIMLRPEDMVRMDFSCMTEIVGGLVFTAVLKNSREYSECILACVDEKQICPVDAVLELWRRVKEHTPDAKGLFYDDLFVAPLAKTKIEREMKWLMLAADIPERFTPYSIKHSAITHLFAVGIDEVVITKNARLSRFSGIAAKHYFVSKAGKICAKAIATAVPDPDDIPQILRQTPLQKQDGREHEKEKDKEDEALQQDETEHQMEVEGGRRELIVDNERQTLVDEEDNETEEDRVVETKTVYEETNNGETCIHDDAGMREAPPFSPGGVVQVDFGFPLELDWSVLGEGFEMEDNIWEGMQIIPAQLFCDSADDIPWDMSGCDALCASGVKRKRRSQAPWEPGGK
jgi:hypothetical protein